MAGGCVRFDGPVADLVATATATGKVWLCKAEHPGAQVTWRTGSGRFRRVGGPPPLEGQDAEPTLEDAYLLMLGAREPRPAAAAASPEAAA